MGVVVVPRRRRKPKRVQLQQFRRTRTLVMKLQIIMHGVTTEAPQTGVISLRRRILVSSREHTGLHCEFVVPWYCDLVGVWRNNLLCAKHQDLQRSQRSDT